MKKVEDVLFQISGQSAANFSSDLYVCIAVLSFYSP